MAHETTRPDGTSGYWGSPMRPDPRHEIEMERLAAIDRVAEGIFVRSRLDAETCFRMADEFVEFRDARRRDRRRNETASGLDGSGSIELGGRDGQARFVRATWVKRFAIFDKNGFPFSSGDEMPVLFMKRESAETAAREHGEGFGVCEVRVEIIPVPR